MIWIKTLFCPGCGHFPHTMLDPGQAFCGNDDCEVLCWNPQQSRDELLAQRHEIPET